VSEDVKPCGVCHAHLGSLSGNEACIIELEIDLLRNELYSDGDLQHDRLIVRRRWWSIKLGIPFPKFPTKLRKRTYSRCDPSQLFCQYDYLQKIHGCLWSTSAVQTLSWRKQGWYQFANNSL